MKHLLVVVILSVISFAAQAAPTCAEYFKYTAQGIDWPYALPMSDFAHRCVLSHERRTCPLPQKHFAIVAEHISGTNSTVYCKLIIVNSNEEVGDFSEQMTRHINCTSTSIEINNLVLIGDTYNKMLDKLGNIICLRSTSLVKVIGKVPY